MLEGAGFILLGVMLRNGWPVGTVAWILIAFAAVVIFLGYDLIDPSKAR